MTAQNDDAEIETGETRLTVEPDEQEVTITRVFDAPRERVFEANTDPDLVPEWWGPRRFTTDVDEMDARPGGRWRFINRDAEGDEYAFHGVYHDVVAPERIVQTFEFEGAPEHVSLETATFEDVGGKTRMTVQSVFQSVEDRDATVESGMEDGARETWERFAALLEKPETDGGEEADVADTPTNETRSMTASRVIEAAPERVYDAFLNPDELAEWLPPAGFTAEVHELEPDVGGTFRITFTADADESDPYSHTFYGTYDELKRGDRIVHTDQFETDDPDMAGEMTVTVSFESVPDGTEVTVRQEGIPEAIPPEDANAGWNDSLESLARIVEEA